MSDVASPRTIQSDTDLWVEFTQSIVDNPAILEDIPNGSTVVLIPDDNPELAESNLQRGLNAARQGADVYIRHVRSSTSTT